MAGINDYSNTAGSNTTINGIDIAEGCSPAGINNAIRQLMADIADVDDGVVALQTPDINGGTIDGAVIGGTTPAAGTFTNLTATGTLTGILGNVSEDSTPQLGGSLDLNSNNITGTGNINITGTVTADGLNVGTGEYLSFSSGDTANSIRAVGGDGITYHRAYNGFNFTRTVDSVNLLDMTTTAGVVFNNGSADLDFRVESNNNAHMLYVNGGTDRVGIGTGSPATPLHLSSTSYPQFRITNAISFSMGVDSNNDLIFDPTSGSTRDIIFQNSGAGGIKVGIGTTSPTQALDVNGTVKATAFQGDGSALTGIGGGGKVLQVVTVTKTNTQSTTSSSFTDITGLSVSITPSSTSSKILIQYVTNMGVEVGTNRGAIQLVRGTTPIAIGDAASNRARVTAAAYGGNTDDVENLAGSWLDSPSTTSATTYKLQFRTTGAGSIHINRSAHDADDSGQFRTSSSIILMEIGA